jgi:phenylpropionate dioxygenase-like ring-hydroxylating dioxygenase large terminal subunit
MNEPNQPSTSLAAMTPRVRAAWYVLALSEELGKKPLRKILFEVPIVLFRGASGAVGALVDRCPHRSVPLSFGEVVGETLQCGYHGWRFERGGRCTAVPGLDGEADVPARCATRYEVREQQGFIWVWGDPATQPVGEPFHFRCADDPAYLTVRRAVPAPGAVHSVIENALDVPHTAFLHRGLFRSDGKRRPITCRVRRFHDRVECEFIGEARPEGLAGRILSPTGGMVTHFDRFYLPSITEVEYRIGEENHVMLNGACTPVSDFDTIVYACVSVRTRLPKWLVKAVVQPLAMYIFRQDAEILTLQTETFHRFGEARYVSTDVDLLGAHILRLMHRAARGEAGDPTAAPYEREVTMWV